MPTLFTTKEAENCPGPWIAICKSLGCTFAIGMPASGYPEAKRIAVEEHKKRPPGKYYCANPEHVSVGRVPDE